MMEPLHLNPNDRTRPADILLGNFQNGHDMAVDIQVSGSLLADTWQLSLKRAETIKRNRY